MKRCNSMHRVISLVLTLVMILGMVPLGAFATEETDVTETTEAYSINMELSGVSSDSASAELPEDAWYYAACGDSITHANHALVEDINTDDPYYPIDGYSGTTYARKNYAYYIAERNHLQWANYGYGGTTLHHCYPKGYGGTSMRTFPFVDERITQLKEGVEWDYISIFFGYNDAVYGPVQQRDFWLTETYGEELGYPVKDSQIGTEGFANAEQKAACDAATGTVGGVEYTDNTEYFFARFVGTVDDTETTTFLGAYNYALDYLTKKYPDAKIMIVNPYVSGTNNTRKIIRDGVNAVAEKWGVSCMDFSDLPYWFYRVDQKRVEFPNPHREDGRWVQGNGNGTFAGTVEGYNRARFTTDGTHPSNLGYQTISKPMERALLDSDNTVYVMQGESFETDLILDDVYTGMDVSVTMGGTDITEQCYANGKIRIESVTGNVIIRADGNITYTDGHTYSAEITAPTCTEAGFTTYTCECGESYVADWVDALGHTYENGICNGCGKELSFEGKKVSILSHSMSTYAGVSNSTAANSTIGKNDVYYTAGRHGVYQKDTWWQQVIDALDMELLVNNSWSGSCVFMPRKGAASIGYGDRAVNLHNDHTGEEPDIILVYLGCNDFAYYKDTFGKAADVDYSALIKDNGDGTFIYAAPATTCEAYAIMLHKAAHRYPGAEIYCITSTARREVDYTGDSNPDAGQPTAYSAELQKVAQYFGYPVVDLEKAIPKEVEIFDQYMGDKRAHANALGMDQITNEVLSVMLGTDAEIRHVTSQSGAVAEQAVLLGGSYRAEADVPQGYSVRVTMGDKDITDEVCLDGKITIAEVTGDIQVETVVKRDPLDFRWEFKDGELVSVGSAGNNLTKLSGTVTNGTLNDGIFQLSTLVVLKHDDPWTVEWTCAEDWRGAVLTSCVEAETKGMTYLSRVNGGQLCFGTYTGAQYDNYGVDISYLDSEVHTYRLENRIAADGSNMVWLYVDGDEIGPMNNYFIGSKAQNKTSDWVSGKDFVFSYIGINGHALRNCRLDYLSIWEAGHTHSYESAVTAPTCTEAGFTTYTCQCGESYVADWVDATGHRWSSWQQIAEENCQGQGRWMRSCETCAVAQYTTDQEGSCVSFNSPAILANAGDTVVLTCYDVAFDADTVADAATIAWSSDQLAVDQGCVTPTDPGVYTLVATFGAVSKTVYLVVKAPEDMEYVLYFDDFTDATLPGYRPIEVHSGARYYVSDGKLTLDASNSVNSYIRVLLPEWIGDFGDYEIRTTFTMMEALDSTKWFAVMARVQNEDVPYLQAPVRFNATAANGIELDQKNEDNTWVILHKTSYTEAISPSKYYTQTFGLSGTTGYHAINGTTLLKSNAMAYGPGDVGFQVRGSVASVDRIKIVIPVDTAAHTFGDWIVTTAPTCTEPGTEIRSCAVCGYTETRDVDPCHDLVQHAEKMHTCTESGWLAYETCTRCDYSTLVEVAPTGHSYHRQIHSVAHRGYSKLAPENTLAAYELAKQLGYFYVEGDVAFTADGIPVLLHDDTIDRTSDGTGKVAKLTYEQLLQYDFGSWKSSAYAGTSIPTFEEFIALCVELDLHPYIELKTSGSYTQAKIQQLVDLVEAYGMTGKVTWISFSSTFLGYVKNADPIARLGYISSGNATESVINTAKKLQTCQNEVFLCLNYSKITNTGILRAAANGFAVEVWTVNSKSAILALPSYVSGVISDGYHAQDIIDSNFSAITAPTCAEQGYTTYTCECGESYVDDYVDATGHNYENGICTGCGEKEPVSYTPGDITGDGQVDNKDLTRLFRYLSSYEVEVNEAALDVTGDGEINNKDLTRLFRYLSGYGVTIQ